MFEHTSIFDAITFKKEEHFVGRKAIIDEFYQVLENIYPLQPNVLIYHGIGGMGKSSLRKKLIHELEKSANPPLIGLINFENIEYQRPEYAYIRLREMLGHKQKIDFPMFDIVYSIYMKKTYPHITFQEFNQPVEIEGEFISELIALLSEIPAISIAPKLINLFNKGSKLVKRQLNLKKITMLKDIAKMDSTTILEQLPKFLCEDLFEWKNKTHQDIIIFVDTYEALWENRRMGGYSLLIDHWLREWVKYAIGIQWVFFSREKLLWDQIDPNWKKVIKSKSLEQMDSEEMLELLNLSMINDPPIQQRLISISKGHPFSLQLLIDINSRIAERRPPNIEDFSENLTSQELFLRFMKYLSMAEIRALEVLSCTRSWDMPLFENLMQEFSTGLTIRDYGELLKFSFVNQNDHQNSYEMHALMKENLQKNQALNMRKRVHKYLFEYYAKRLDSLALTEQFIESVHLFEEAYYQGIKQVDISSRTVSDLCNWFREIDSRFFQAGKWFQTIPILSSFLDFLKSGNYEEYGVIVYDLAYIYFKQAEYEKALELFQQSYNHHLKVYGRENAHTAKSMYGLGIISHNIGEYEIAEKYYIESLEIRQRVNGEEHLSVAFSINTLATLYQDMGQYEKAESLYLRSLRMAEEQSRINANGSSRIAFCKLNLSYFYDAVGDFDKSLIYAAEAVNIRITLFGEEHIEVAFGNIGYANALIRNQHITLAEKILADVYIKTKAHFDENHFIVSLILHNLAICKWAQGDYIQSETNIRKAIYIKQHLLKEGHWRIKSSTKVLREILDGNQVDINKVPIDYI
jgi:tetratricopeptide (TPR) repeat protein